MQPTFQTLVVTGCSAICTASIVYVGDILRFFSGLCLYSCLLISHGWNTWQFVSGRCGAMVGHPALGGSGFLRKCRGHRRCSAHLICLRTPTLMPQYSCFSTNPSSHHVGVVPDLKDLFLLDGILLLFMLVQFLS
jgi:hypothetical protein